LTASDSERFLKEGCFVFSDEEKLKTLEEAQADALEMAEKAHAKREAKKSTEVILRKPLGPSLRSKDLRPKCRKIYIL
jgi:F420-dependent methylenetetrahydromethanopterin dehydrogenase